MIDKKERFYLIEGFEIKGNIEGKHKGYLKDGIEEGFWVIENDKGLIEQGHFVNSRKVGKWGN